jgi:hypothetical protein
MKKPSIDHSTWRRFCLTKAEFADLHAPSRSITDHNSANEVPEVTARKLRQNSS